MTWLTREEIAAMGFAHVGEGALLSDKASYHNRGNIVIGEQSRIDDFCVLAAGNGGIRIGRNVHIAVFCSLIGSGMIELQDFSGLSSRVSIYSSSDDYSGRAMTNPTVPAEFTNVCHDEVILESHVIVGAGSVLLPGIRLEQGVAIGALSLVTSNCRPFGIYAGNPASRIRERKRDLLDAAFRFLAQTNIPK